MQKFNLSLIKLSSFECCQVLLRALPASIIIYYASLWWGKSSKYAACILVFWGASHVLRLPLGHYVTLQQFATIVAQSYAANSATIYIHNATYVMSFNQSTVIRQSFRRTLCSARCSLPAAAVCVHNFCNYTLPISSNIFISFEKREREREMFSLLTLFRAKRNSVRYVAIFILMPQSFLAGVDSNKYHVHPLPLFLFMAPPRHNSLPHLMLLHCGRPNCNWNSLLVCVRQMWWEVCFPLHLEYCTICAQFAVCLWVWYKNASSCANFLSILCSQLFFALQHFEWLKA